MLKYPENYEDAKVILKNAVNDEYTKNRYKVLKYRTKFATAVGVGISTAAGLLTNNINVFNTLLPIFLVLNLGFYTTLYHENVARKKIKNNTYFDNLTEDRVISMARGYVTEYNNYEAEKEGRSR